MQRLVLLVTASVPVATVNGCRCYDDGLGGLTAYRGPALVGLAFPKVTGHQEGPWFARRRGMDVRLFATRGEALRWLTQEEKS